MFPFQPRESGRVRLVASSTMLARAHEHLSPEQFEDLLEDRVCEAERQVLHAHLSSCVRCGLKLPRRLQTREFLDRCQDAFRQAFRRE